MHSYFSWIFFFFILYFKKISGANANKDQIKTAIIEDSLSYGILLSVTTLVQLIAGIFAIDCFNQTALRQITRIRIKYFQSLMRQEIGWYDVAGSNNNFAVRATEWVKFLFHYKAFEYNGLLLTTFLLQRYWKDSWWYSWESEPFSVLDYWFSDLRGYVILLWMEIVIGGDIVCAHRYDN